MHARLLGVVFVAVSMGVFGCSGSGSGGTGGGSGTGGSNGGGSGHTGGGSSGGGSSGGGSSGGGSGGGSSGGGSSQGGGSSGGGSQGGGSSGGGSSGFTCDAGSGTETAAGADCASAPTAAVGTSIFSDSSDGGGVLISDGNNCQGQFANAPVASANFKVSVPANNVLTVTVGGCFDSVLNLISAPATNCGTLGTDDAGVSATNGIMCLAGADMGITGEPETAIWANSGTSAQDVFVQVSGYSDSNSDLNGAPDQGPFTLTTSVATIPAGNTCAAPTAIAASGTLTMQTTTGFFDLNDIDPNTTSCVESTTGNALSGFVGNDQVYSISVPSGMTLTATVAPTGADMASEDPSIYLVASPPTNCGLNIMSCLNEADTGGSGESDTVTWQNDAGTANVYIIVDSYQSGAMTQYSLTTALQ
jgi:hypothetical protein